ncbi:LOW QUALITY PROTEIN: T-box transcription factor tbx2 [Plakobranchus ocellatus]|uniref:T-box transcription factor tbx2 n=1 Tax=Plakobranchus ocellatus TaxID=259542 RepID=A0AAV4DJK1_9GAST|nr:LOW QUALITY PROTEIN: T-box transcription factor tbx2 [Plakobranchus ocellatus]
MEEGEEDNERKKKIKWRGGRGGGVSDAKWDEGYREENIVERSGREEGGGEARRRREEKEEEGEQVYEVVHEKEMEKEGCGTRRELRTTLKGEEEEDKAEEEEEENNYNYVEEEKEI